MLDLLVAAFPAYSSDTGAGKTDSDTVSFARKTASAASQTPPPSSRPRSCERQGGGEPPTIVQAVHIDDCARSNRRLRDGRDEDTATVADQKIAGASSEAVILYQRPIIRRELEEPFVVGNDARAVTTAERACARAQQTVLRRLRKLKTYMQAVTPAKMLHATEYPGSARSIKWHEGYEGSNTALIAPRGGRIGLRSEPEVPTGIRRSTPRSQTSTVSRNR